MRMCDIVRGFLPCNACNVCNTFDYKRKNIKVVCNVCCNVCNVVRIMAEKSIKQFIGEMKDALAFYGADGIHSMQVLDAQGMVIKQTDNWIDEATFLKMEKIRKVKNDY
jgi:hypothetical protein